MIVFISLFYVVLAPLHLLVLEDGLPAETLDGHGEPPVRALPRHHHGPAEELLGRVALVASAVLVLPHHDLRQRQEEAHGLALLG